MKLLIASHNVHKIREIRAILKEGGRINDLDVLSLIDFPDFVPAEETGETFENNATLKAVKAAKELGIFTLADDSGLVVPHLNNQPGVRSARFAGENATDCENRRALLEKLDGVPEEKRGARYECVMVLTNPKGEVIKVASGNCEGHIIESERGNSGFGYDPIFMKSDYSKTFAELEETRKNLISHRGKALERIKNFLEHFARENALSN